MKIVARIRKGNVDRIIFTLGTNKPIIKTGTTIALKNTTPYVVTRLLGFDFIVDIIKRTCPIKARIKKGFTKRTAL
jgi:hypothetical protein